MNICPECSGKMIDVKTDYEINGIKFNDINVKKCVNCGKVLIESDTMNELLSKVMIEAQKTEYVRQNEKISRELSNMVLVCKLKEKRLEKNLTQQDVAERINALSQRISAIERTGKNISIEKGFKIAYALGCDINEIFQLVNKEDFNMNELVIKERTINYGKEEQNRKKASRPKKRDRNKQLAREKENINK